MRPYYITTPIYYVNDRPHIGHCYTTLIADAAARMQRLIRGGDGTVFFLTGTDEHAEKVVTAAAEHGATAMEWADLNAGRFREAFAEINCSHDDFIRTTEHRHKSRVLGYMRELLGTGDVYMGDYQGWFDPSQEEYVTEHAARKAEFKSPVTGKPLEKRTEKNYFFRLSKYGDRLREHIEAHGSFILPEARRNEVLGRIRQGLQDVPISRAITDESDAVQTWGIRMPGDDTHRIYVWIDALFNYLSAVDTDERRELWPATVHVIAKDILWFHAVVWPCMLMALERELPAMVYSHSYWVAEGRKMSKSLGNFIDLPLLRGYMERYSLDAVRWYLITRGPLGVTDADFSHANFVEVYNADLANTVGNSINRVGNMIGKYCDGCVPDPKGATELEGHDWPSIALGHVERMTASADGFDLVSALRSGTDLVTVVDGYINQTEPFRLAKKLDEDPANRDRLNAILYHCAEALRIASLLLWPAMPQKMEEVWSRWKCVPPRGVPLRELAAWGGAHSLTPGQRIEKGSPLFMRADADDPPPTPIGD
ncbi:MAG: methionine--tRNA ligase [Planctomycetes bacterium]|nr:methionine--tRNA ligase [Planctomycetota bacterium]